MQSEPNTCSSSPLEDVLERLSELVHEINTLIALSGVYDLATGELREEYQ